MDYEIIEEKVKNYVFNELRECDFSSPVMCRAIAFGVVHFAANNLFPTFNEELSEWWNTEMWDKFTEKMIGGKNNE